MLKGADFLGAQLDCKVFGDVNGPELKLVSSCGGTLYLCRGQQFAATQRIYRDIFRDHQGVMQTNQRRGHAQDDTASSGAEG